MALAEGPHVLNLTALAADWTAGARYKLLSITLTPGLANDVLVVKSESATGPVLARIVCPTTAPVQLLMHGIDVKPMIDISDCTLSTGHNVCILFK